jgi:predicted ArsR family transcriptional regulator
VWELLAVQAANASGGEFSPVSASAIARKIGKSRNVVRENLQRLIVGGILERKVTPGMTPGYRITLNGSAQPPASQTVHALKTGTVAAPASMRVSG